MKLGKTFLKTVCHCATLAQRNNAGSALVVREMLKVFVQNHNSNLSKSWYGLFNNFIYFDCWKLFLAQIWHNGTRTKTDLCHILCHRCDAKTYLIITTNSYLQTKTNYVITRQKLLRFYIIFSSSLCKNFRNINSPWGNDICLFSLFTSCHLFQYKTTFFNIMPTFPPQGVGVEWIQRY